MNGIKSESLWFNCVFSQPSTVAQQQEKEHETQINCRTFFSAVFVKYCIASFTRVKNQNIPPFFFSQFGGSTEQQKKEKKDSTL